MATWIVTALRSSKKQNKKAALPQIGNIVPTWTEKTMDLSAEKALVDAEGHLRTREKQRECKGIKFRRAIISRRALFFYTRRPEGSDLRWTSGRLSSRAFSPTREEKKRTLTTRNMGLKN